MIIDLCDRWHKLPQEVLSADASLLRLLRIVAEGTPTPTEGVNDV